jgi:hypothetical protein
VQTKAFDESRIAGRPDPSFMKIDCTHGYLLKNRYGS